MTITNPVKLFTTPVSARSTVVYTAQLVDQNGNGIPASSLTSLTLSLFDKGSGAVINNIQDVNILNTGRGVIDANGNLTITFSSADTIIIGTPFSGALQYRSMVIMWTYNSGASNGRRQVDFSIMELAEA